MKGINKSTIIKSIKDEFKMSGSLKAELWAYSSLNALLRNNPAQYAKVAEEIAEKIKSTSKFISFNPNYELYQGVKCLTDFTMVAKPCKEFESLNNWLYKYAGTKLGYGTIRENAISGKRSWYEVNSTSYLMHQPKRCKEILEMLRKHRSTNDKIELRKISDIYWGDRFNSYGEDRECEWDGSEFFGVKLTIKTPTGREKFDTEIYA